MKKHSNVKSAEQVLIEKHSIFKGAVPTSTTVQDIGSGKTQVNFIYEVNNKKYISTVIHSTTDSKESKVIEMSQVPDLPAPVTFEVEVKA